MPDVFDEVAVADDAEASPTPQGDIFDQVSSDAFGTVGAEPSLTPETDKVLKDSESLYKERHHMPTGFPEHVTSFLQGAGLPTNLEGLKTVGKFLIRNPAQDVRDIYQAISELPGRLSDFKQTLQGSPAATVYEDPFSKEAFGVYGTAVGMLIPAAQKGITALKGVPEAPTAAPEPQPLQTIEVKLPLGGEEDAISQPETTQPYGDVQQPEVQTESAGQMPADVGSEGIPAGGQGEILEPETPIATEPVISQRASDQKFNTQTLKWELKTDRDYWADGSELRSSVINGLSRLGVDVSQTDLPSYDQFKTGKEFFDAMRDAEGRMRSSGAKLAGFVLNPENTVAQAQEIAKPSPESPATEQPTEALSPPEDTGSKPAYYRGGGEGSPPKGKTAADIVNYETTELGNNITPAKGIDLKSIPSERTQWVSPTEAQAAEFGAVEPVQGNFRVLATDPDGGVLVEKLDTGSKPVAPRLLTGETQGDLISSTQEEPLKLVGEETPDFEAQMTAEQKAELARMKAESEQEQLAGLEEYQQRGGQELVPAISSLGGLRETAPDFGMVREAFLGKSKHGTQASARSVVGDIRYGDIFKKNAPHEDALVQALRERGFDIETPGQLADILDTRLKTGKEIWGMEARAQEADFTGHQGYAMGVRGQPDLTTKIIKSVQAAVDAIQTGIGRKPLGAIEPPTLNLDTGGVKPPPPASIFSPDTPPGDDPVPIYATRVNSAFKRWWEKFWPRDLAVQKLDKVLAAKGKEPSPVVSAHQEILRTNMNYMQNFSEQPWWRALRGRPESDIIDVEDRVIKEYRKHIENGVDREQAYKGAVGKAPKWFQDIVRQREARIPIETRAAEELGVDAPQYTGDPYIARLTNEEGKDVVDLNPRLSNIGKQIRTTIGSFDNSREHVTMKDGIAAGTQYEPVARAVWLREMNSIRLESTADLVRSLKEKGVLFDKKKAAFDASPAGKISLVRGLGGKQYWTRSPEEAVFLEQNISSVPRSPLGRIQQLANTYVRNPSLVNPLPHVTKNMFFKYLMARINNATFKADVADFARATPSELKTRFDRVMPFSESAERMPQLTAREVGTWAEKASTRGMKMNNMSSNFIFQKADPAMRYALWKSYVRKGMADQEAANHVWIDLIRYDANSGGMNFWKSIPFNFFVPWRTGTYVTLAKALTSHPIRTLAFIGAIEYLRELRYRKSGRWTHLPVDYIDAPLAEAVESGTKVRDFKSGREAAQMTAMTAATTLVFGPGGGQAPSTIKDVMAVLQNDPQQKARVMNMFWGLSQIYDLPREWNAFQKDNNPQHLVNLLTSAALAEHSALKYEPRRLMKWLPEWMPGLQKSEIVQEAEQLQARVAAKAEKGKATYEARHGVSASFERSPETQQLEELGRAAGMRKYGRKAKTIAAP